MKNIISPIFIIVAFVCCWQGEAFAQNNSFFDIQKEAISERTWQIRKEFNQKNQAEEPEVDFNDQANRDRYFSKLDYWLENVYPHRDTIGSQQLYERVLSPQLQQAVRHVLETTERTSNDITIDVFEKNDKQYCSITPLICVLGGGGDGESGGYLLYQNNILVEIHYDSKALAELVMKPDELKELPYDLFIPVDGEYVLVEYDGPSDYYLITGQDSLEFIGRLDYWEELP